jgi:hypothetical protein
MKEYRNVIIVGEKTNFVVMSYENIYKPVTYKRFNKFDNQGKNNTDTVNSLIIINKYLSEIYNSDESNPHYFVVPNKICTAIKNGTYKNWIKTGKTASGKTLEQDELYQWVIFASLYKELFNAINFKPLSYYNMKNIKYNIQQMNFTKELINKAYSYLERNKNKNFMDSLSDIL